MHNPDSEIVSSERTFFKIICNITITFCQRWQILICDYVSYSTAEAFFFFAVVFKENNKRPSWYICFTKF